MPIAETEKQFETQKRVKFLGLRHVQFVMLFFSTLVGYGIRTNMSVGILAMMDKKQTDPSIPTFPNWTKKEIILSSFFWGYVVPQIGAGQLVKNYGAKWFLCCSMALNCLFTILVPVMAVNYGETGVIICRVLQGFNQGFLYPSIHTLLGKWTPLPERTKIASFVYSGGPLGTAISLAVTGVISDSSAGWPAAFYLYGGLGFVWAFIWAILGANSPDDHKSISVAEIKYIQGNSLEGHEKKELPTPWKAILTSLPFWAILVSHSGESWGFWTLLNEIPTYMEKIMKYSISNNSLLSALPYLVLVCLNFVFGAIADFLVTKKYLSIGSVRKIMNSIALYIPAAALIGLGFVSETQKNLAIGLLVIAVGVNAAMYSGFNVNHIDIAPNFAGPLMGITNCVSNIFSILAPLAVDLIGIKQDDPVLWRIVFCFAAGVYIVTNTFYVIFASGEVQDWNEERVNDVNTIGKIYDDSPVKDRKH